MTDDLDVLIDAACESVIRRCKCGKPSRKRQSYCNECHAAYMRENRPKHSEMSETAKAKANARSYLREYIRRGKIVVGPCEVCGITELIEGHHPDHTKPIEVVWLCKKHHMEASEHERISEALKNSPVTNLSDMESFHVELREAIWGAIKGGMKLSTLLGEVRREAVNVAIEHTGSRNKAARHLGIDRMTVYRSETHRHKF